MIDEPLLEITPLQEASTPDIINELVARSEACLIVVILEEQHHYRYFHGIRGQAKMLDAANKSLQQKIAQGLGALGSGGVS